MLDKVIVGALCVPMLLSVVSFNLVGVAVWASCIGFYWFLYMKNADPDEQ